VPRVLALIMAAALVGAAVPSRLVAQQAQGPTRSLSLDEALRIERARGDAAGIARWVANGGALA